MSMRRTTSTFFLLLVVAAIETSVLVFGPCLLQYLEPCTNNTIQFYLFSSDRPEEAPYLLDNESPVFPKWLDPGYDFKIIVHGYAGNLDFNVTKLVRSGYLKIPSTNVIAADWGKLAKYPCYPTAAFNTRQAGECLAKFLLKVEENNVGFKAHRLHAIGFSLGAHVVSFASNNLANRTGSKMQRITGLDPALPFFATSNVDWKLDSSDAEFVDVIHTNAGIYGKIESCGHADFYLNGGQFQPACRRNRNRPLCSHMLAPEYFTESFITETDGFWGAPCDSYFQYIFGLCPSVQRIESLALMGENCDPKTRGTFFVTTREKPPYALGLAPLVSNEFKSSNDVR